MRKAIIAAGVVLLLGVASVAVADHGGGWPYHGSGWLRSSDSGAGWSTLADYRNGESRHGRARVAVLEEVLSEMVAEGTLAQVQVDMILTALEAKLVEMAEARDQARETWESIWEDEILTEDEINQLPMADHILQMEGVAQALADGQITKAELEELYHGKGEGHRGRGNRGHRGGHR